MTDFDYAAILRERHAQEDRLTDAGIQVDGGGVDMTTGQWDIFAYPNDDVYVTVVSSIDEVDSLIRDFGRTHGVAH